MTHRPCPNCGMPPKQAEDYQGYKRFGCRRFSSCVEYSRLTIEEAVHDWNIGYERNSND